MMGSKKKPKKTPASVSAQTGAKKKTHQRHNGITTAARVQGGESVGAGKSNAIPHGRIPRTFWKDPRMRELQREHRELLLYLYESDQAFSEGIFYFSAGEAAEDLVLMAEEVRAGIAALTEHGFLVFDAMRRIVCVTEAMGIQLPKSDNESKGWAQRVVRLREATVFPVWRERLAYYLARTATGPAHALPKYVEAALTALDGKTERTSNERRTGVE